FSGAPTSPTPATPLQPPTPWTANNMSSSPPATPAIQKANQDQPTWPSLCRNCVRGKTGEGPPRVLRPIRSCCSARRQLCALVRLPLFAFRTDCIVLVRQRLEFIIRQLLNVNHLVVCMMN